MQQAETTGLTPQAQIAFAKGLYKLMAVKDPWEVARLYTQPEFTQALGEIFESSDTTNEFSLTFHFGAWPFAKKDPKTGQLVKGSVSGRRAMQFFKLLNRFRWLRGTWLDPFARNDEAKLARSLLTDYLDDFKWVQKKLRSLQASATAEDASVQQQVLELLSWPEQVRGYGHVRQRHADQVARQREAWRA